MPKKIPFLNRSRVQRRFNQMAEKKTGLHPESFGQLRHANLTKKDKQEVHLNNGEQLIRFARKHSTIYNHLPDDSE